MNIRLKIFRVSIERIVRDKLKALRIQHYPHIRDFTAETRIYDANVRRIEAPGSTTLPSFINLYRWVRACGMTLSEFFADIEASEKGNQTSKSTEHAVVAAVKVLAARDSELADLLLKIVSRMTPQSVAASQKKQRRAKLR